jgi:hypothetical protein
MATKPGKPVPKEGLLCVVRVPCCRCVDGTSTEIRIDTGAVPWRVTTPLSSLQQAAVPVASIPGSWANQLAPAIWIGPPGQPEDVGVYEYELQFYVPDCVIPSQIYVSGKAAADNRATIYFDGNLTTNPVVQGFTNGHITPFTVGPVTGTGVHKLRFAVTNDGGPTGLIVQAAITVRCPDKLEHGVGGAVPTDGSQQD